MIPPRPTMSEADRIALRAFFASPAGLAVLGQVAQSRISSELNRAILDHAQPEDFWRDSATGERLDLPSDLEAASADPLDPLRLFPAPKPPNPLARPVSPWPFILVTILSTVACATLIAWFVASALKAHA